MRQRKLYPIVIPCLFCLLFVTVAACSQPPPATESAPGLKPAAFEVGPITFEPPVVMVDDSVTVNATVNNVGDTAGTYTALLTIDRQVVDSQDIPLDARSSREVSFQHFKSTAGSYNLAIGNSSAVLTVYNWSPYTIQYYDDTYAYWPPIYVSGEMGHIVRFTPPNKAFRIQKIHIGGGVHFLFSTDLDKYNYTIRIWDSDSTNILWSQDIPWRLFGGDIEVPDIRVDDDFLVEIVTHSTPTCFVPHTEIPKPCGDPIGWATEKTDWKPGFRWSPMRVVGIAFCCYSQPSMKAPHSEIRSGYSYMGKQIDPEKDKSLGKSFTDINWAISVEGEGAPGN